MMTIGAWVNFCVFFLLYLRNFWTLIYSLFSELWQSEFEILMAVLSGFHSFKWLKWQNCLWTSSCLSRSASIKFLQDQFVGILLLVSVFLDSVINISMNKLFCDNKVLTFHTSQNFCLDFTCSSLRFRRLQLCFRIAIEYSSSWSKVVQGCIKRLFNHRPPSSAYTASWCWLSFYVSQYKHHYYYISITTLLLVYRFLSLSSWRSLMGTKFKQTSSWGGGNTQWQSCLHS